MTFQTVFTKLKSKLQNTFFKTGDQNIERLCVPRIPVILSIFRSYCPFSGYIVQNSADIVQNSDLFVHCIVRMSRFHKTDTNIYQKFIQVNNQYYHIEIPFKIWDNTPHKRITDHIQYWIKTNHFL